MARSREQKMKSDGSDSTGQAYLYKKELKLSPAIRKAKTYLRPNERAGGSSCPDLIADTNRENFITEHRKLKLSISTDGASLFSNNIQKPTSDGPRRCSSFRNLASVRPLKALEERASSFTNVSAGKNQTDTSKMESALPASAFNGKQVLERRQSHRSNSPTDGGVVDLSGVIPLIKVDSPDINRPSAQRQILPKSSKLSVESSKKTSSQPYVDKNCAEIEDYLYLATIHTAYNEQLLCKLGINYIIDMSNLQPNEVPLSKISTCPCTCSAPWKHSRVRLNLTIQDDSENDDISKFFSDINEFIKSARVKGHKVLIHCFTGKSLSILAVIQYLMSEAKMNLAEAYHLILKRRPEVKLSPNFQKILLKLEAKLFPGVSPSCTFDESTKRPQNSTNITSATTTNTNTTTSISTRHEAWV